MCVQILPAHFVLESISIVGVGITLVVSSQLEYWYWCSATSTQLLTNPKFQTLTCLLDSSEPVSHYSKVSFIVFLQPCACPNLLLGLKLMSAIHVYIMFVTSHYTHMIITDKL